MKSLIITLLLGISFLSNPALSEETESSGVANEKLDRIDQKLDTLIDSQNKTYKIVKDDPIGSKNFGVELNIARLLVFEEERAVSGGFSLFDHKRKVEYAFPIFYQNSIKNDGYWGDAENNKRSIRISTIDFHYRTFLNDRLNGFYISGFTRLAYLKGTLQCNYYGVYETSSCSRSTKSETKLGVGVGIGYRIFSSKRLYWGTSLSIGKYITGDKYDFELGEFDDGEYIFDMELLKFGWAF
ncbi:MAG: hypothetical protein L3J70_03195 [Gammaproteobacteria bacterium]|nr:hypothetical protein [Gammaproteobacteria bacterium]